MMNNKIRILLTKILLHLVMNNPLCTSRIRRRTLIICGAKIGKNTFIGQNLYFDPLAIHNICAGENSYITQNVSILTHFYGADRRFYFSNANIGDHCFIAMNTLICKPVNIGNNCIYRERAAITKDIPDNVVAAGVPCNVLKYLE